MDINTEHWSECLKNQSSTGVNNQNKKMFNEFRLSNVFMAGNKIISIHKKLKK